MQKYAKNNLYFEDLQLMYTLYKEQECYAKE